MKGFGIYVKNAILEKKHHDNMGRSVWLYMWLLDRMTSISEEGVGLVLGGKPIKHEDFTDNLSLSRRTYARYVEQLESFGYISTTRTPYGLVFRVHKAEKIFNNSVDKSKKRYANSGTPLTKNGTSLYKSGTSNKTKQLDNTVRQRNLNKYKTPNELGMPQL